MLERLLHFWCAQGNTATVLVCGIQSAAQLGQLQILPYSPTRLRGQLRDADAFITHLQTAHQHLAIARRAKIPTALIVHNESDAIHLVNPALVDLVIWNSVWLRKQFPHPIASVIVRPPIKREYYEVFSPPGQRQYITLVNDHLLKGGDVFYFLARQNPDMQFLAVRTGYTADETIENEFDDLPANLTFWDQTPNLVEVFKQSRVVLCPSQAESFGMAIVEAAAAGCAVASVDLPGPREALSNDGAYWIPHAKRKILNEWRFHIRRLVEDDVFFRMWQLRAQNAARRLDSTIDCEQFTQAIYQLASRRKEQPTKSASGATR